MSSPGPISASPDAPIRKRARFYDVRADQDDGWLGSVPQTDVQQRSPLAEGDVLMRAMNGAERKRDDMYYMADGSCVLLVEETLFNVHRTILSRDGSSFCTMFSLPQGDREPEGSSDENPIILTGDTVVEFKHFLWALYALPHELAVVHSIKADLTQLISIARVSNKYNFRSIETWALDAIQEYVNQRPSPIFNLLPIPQYTLIPGAGTSIDANTTLAPSHSLRERECTAQLTRLVRLAQMCNHGRLLGTMIEILRQLMSLSVQYAYITMTVADEFNLRELQGVAYLEVMQKASFFRRCVRVEGERSSSDESWEVEGDVDSDGYLLVTAKQQQRLLSGYYRLTHVWEQLRISPLHFDHAPSCGTTWHMHSCTQSWLEFWKERSRSEAVLNLGLADVIGRLKALQKEFDRWGSSTYMHNDCRITARRCIQERIKSVEDSLSDYFVDEAESVQ